MKKLYIVLLGLICAMLLSSCSAQTPNQTGSETTEKVSVEAAEQTEDVLSHFKGFKNFDEVMSEACEVDISIKADFKNLTKKTEKDDESATAVDYYYSGDVLVYKDYKGYGEAVLEYYCTSEQGTPLKVIYAGEGNIKFCLGVETEDYSVSFDKLNEESKYKADSIRVSVFQNEENDFPKKLNYTYENETLYISSANYYESDGYHYYRAYADENMKITEESGIEYKKENGIKNYSKLKAFCQDPRVDEVDLLIGSGEWCYTENEGKKTWFYKGNAYAVFSDRYKAYKFAQENSLEAKQDENDEDYWLVEIKDKYFEFSPSFDDFYSFAESEVNDNYYASIVIDKNGRIKAIEGSELSYY